ncbi:hypothetical protein ED312_08925 [Sinomicrobium pectinilyticum]|uniref:Uncharacterized protein n=1 Tax=Sinomicrobium pectinilyticum TaxID=1084421 RepID=A0A3N0EKE8_SINP1|nr:hypothetical protein ED312_08925 [Sinomicrobium pectinilyticum]
MGSLEKSWQRSLATSRKSSCPARGSLMWNQVRIAGNLFRDSEANKGWYSGKGWKRNGNYPETLRKLFSKSFPPFFRLFFRYLRDNFSNLKYENRPTNAPKTY